MQKESVINRLKEIKNEYLQLLTHLENDGSKEERELLLPLMKERYDAIDFAINELSR